MEPQSLPIASDCTFSGANDLDECHMANATGVERVAGWWLAVNAEGVELACAPLDRLDNVLRTLGHDPATVAIEYVPSEPDAHFLGGIEVEIH